MHTTVASLSSMVLVLASKEVACPALMDAAVDAALACVPSVSVAHSEAGTETASTSAAEVTNSAPPPAAKLLHAHELVPLLFALGRARHVCAPHDLDVLVGVLARELGVPGQMRPSHSQQQYVSGWLPQSQEEDEEGQQPLSAQERKKQPQSEEIWEELPLSAQETKNQHTLPSGLLSMALTAFVSLRYQPPPHLLSAICRSLSGAASQLSTHTACEVVSSLAALQV